MYKFFSGILAGRIKSVLGKIIHDDQKGFISGKFIGENTRLTFDIIMECERLNKDGIIMTIAFEKAFDMVSRDFIQKCLQIFNFWGSNSKVG